MTTGSMAMRADDWYETAEPTEFRRKREYAGSRIKDAALCPPARPNTISVCPSGALIASCDQRCVIPVVCFHFFISSLRSTTSPFMVDTLISGPPPLSAPVTSLPPVIVGIESFDGIGG